MLLQGIHTIREIVRGLAVDRLLTTSAQSIIAKAGSESRPDNPDELIAHIPDKRIAIQGAQIAILIMVRRKPIKGQWSIGSIIGR